MSERRCPNCGGLVGEGIEFCGQCFHRIPAAASEPALAAPIAEAPVGPATPVAEAAGDPAPEAPAAVAPVAVDSKGQFLRAADGSLMWACPACDLHNPIEAMTCTRCGTPFRQVFGEERLRPKVEPSRAVTLSLMFPGLGHRAIGRGVEGLSRALFFLWALGTSAAILFSRGSQGPGRLLPFVLVMGAAAVALYVLSAVDAGRLARGEGPVLPTKTLLFSFMGLMLLLMAVMVLLVFGARS